jgi:hypothetical protein
MGGPLGPTMANFFLGHIESTLFSNISFSPELYLRYVDDIFAVFSDKDAIDQFFQYLNTQHPNLSFTLENATNTLAFLDVELEITDASFESWVYRKKTHTGVFMNFNAVVPDKWKVGLIVCLLNRAWNICSSRLLFMKEVQKLKLMFVRNGYPYQFLNKIVERFLQTRNSERTQRTEEVNKYVLRVPYVGKASVIFKTKLSKLIKENFKVDVLPVFTSFKVANYFSLKCRTPTPLVSNVVYRFTCLHDAGETYIGKTKRHLITRVEEHLAFNKPEIKSSIKEHVINCDTCQSCKLGIHNFEILKICKNDFEAQIHEALLVRKVKPSLNVQLFASGASYLLQIY